MRTRTYGGVGGAEPRRFTPSRFPTFPPRLFVAAVRPPLVRVPPQPMRPVANTPAPLQVLVHGDVAARQRPAPSLPLELQAQVLHAHRVVATHRALIVQGEDLLQVAPWAASEGRATLRRPHLKALIELGDVVLPQKAIGLFHRGDPTQPQLLRQPSLPGPEVALRTAPRLRRIGGNHLNPQLAQRPAYLRYPMGIHLATRLRRQPEMAAPIAVQRAEQALALDHFAQSRHHRRRRFFLHQLPVVDLAGGVVQNHQQVVPALVLKPLVPAAVNVQQHAGQRPPRGPLRAPPGLPPPPPHPRPLQRRLHPRVAQPDAVLLAQLLVKMPHVEIEVLLPIQPQHPLHRFHWHPLLARPAAPPVQYPVEAELLIAFSPAPQMPVGNAENLGRLIPRDLARHRPQHDFLHFHRPLHRGPRIRFHTFHGRLSSPPAKRTFHVLNQPDISCANDMKSQIAGLRDIVASIFFRALFAETTLVYFSVQK